ncbi:hypothetical protein PLESTF_000438200 [Pleodorina starrii]|nr:hypothetical protein PLESTF_000438200 [Pleodorina starrii]
MNGNAALLQQHAEALALSSPLLLPYERQLLEDAIMDDSMIITAAGLGWQRVAAVLLRIAQHARMAGANELDAPQAQNQLASQQQHSDPAHPQPAAAASAAARATSSPTAPPVAAAPGPQHPARGGLPGCVLVLGASPWQRALITSELARHDPSLPPPVDITNEVPASERVQLYRASPGGRPLFITPRILVVDLLAHRLRGREVAGVLLLNAHRASDTSGEGFAVALLRADCPAGGRGGAGAGCWVRALSDAPVAFNQGFNRVEKVMKALHLRRLHLWPRFQEHVRQCLDEHKPVVVEWDQELSSAMLLIQAALLEVLEGLIRELRRTNNKLDTSELVLENGVLRSFDEIVRRQLDPIWHTVSWKTRRICADLRTLRELSALLLSTDCVTFLAHLEGLRQSEGARRRVYIYRQQGAVEKAAAAAVGSGGGGGEGSEVEAVLEEPPKWGLLVEVLGEVQRQRRQLRALGQLDPQGAAAAIAAAGQREGAAADTTTRGSGGGGAQDRGRSTTEASIRSRTAAAAESGVEVVDLASSDEGSDGAKEDEEDGRHVRGRAAGVAAGGTAAASNARGGAAAAGAGGAEADAAVDGPSLRALLEELGLLSDNGGAAGGGGAAASAAAAAGGDKAGGPSGSAGAGAVPGCGPVDAAAAVVTLRDLRLLAEAGRGPVLVVARELHSARLLERVVREGGRAVMQHLYESYLLSKLSTSEGGAGRGGANGSGGGTTGGRAGGRAGGRGGGRGGGWKRYRGGSGGDPDESGRGPVLRPGEHQALLAEAHRVGAERGDLTEVPGGRAAKRAKLGQGEAGGAAGGTAGGGRGARGRGSAAGGGGSARGRGRRGGGCARRQRKPDDSPVRVAAAAEEEEEGMEEEEVEEKGEEGRAAAATRAATATGAHSGVLPRAGRAGRAGRAAAAAAHAGGGNGDDEEEEDDDEGGGSDPQSDADEWADRGQQPRSRRAAPQSRGGGGRGTGGRGRAGAGGGRGAGRAEQRGGRGRGGGRRGNGAAAPGKGTAPATAGGRGAAAAARPESAAAAGGANATGQGDGGDGLGAGSPPQPSSPPPPPPPPLLVDVHFVSLDSHDEFVLWRLRPSFVIMYEPDLAFLRQVEVYQAERCLAGGCPLWLHTLSYGQSLEQQRFRAAVERERDTLLRLIQAKQHLVLPAQAVVAQGPNGAGGGGGGALSADLWLDVYSANALTRAAGGRAAARGGGLGGGGPGGPKRLVVDVREFMSSLPAVLHQKGFELLPVTLEVGDYVLSPQLVVERKSLPDLHASLASGRLYHQAEVMCRHYARPLLLIEFDADRQFGLQSASELGDDIDPKNVISKLTLLTLHFPKLRLLWSRSPHATADLFASLKSNQDEPDPAAAALVGVPLGPDGVPLPLQPGAAPGQGQGQGSGAAGGPAAAYPLESVVNQPALELLRRLPGVNDSNYRAILGHVSSLAELAALPLQRLESIMASAKNARALREFLDAPCPRI